jgi:hypothetical protein
MSTRRSLLVLDLNVDLIDSDASVWSSDVKLWAVGAPWDTGAGRVQHSSLQFGTNDRSFGLDFGDQMIVFLGKVPDLESIVTSSSYPLQVSVEWQAVHFAFSLESEDRLFHISEVPDLNFLVLSSSSNVLTVSGQSQSTDETVVSLHWADKVENASPKLESAVETDTGVVRVLGGLTVSDLGNPVGVVIVGGSDFALTFGVPELDVGFETTTEDLSVVLAEADWVDFFGVLDELAGAFAWAEVPEAESVVPRAGDDVEVVVRDGKVSHEVVVAGELLEGHTELIWLFVLGVELPDDQSLVSGTRNQDWVFGLVALNETRHDGSDFAVVTV